MLRREPAWRLLSGEFSGTAVMLKAKAAKKPNYALTPLGAKVNRVFIVGKAVEKEDIGTDSRSFYRIKLSDPTGVFYVTVGEYQPEALEAIEKIDLPSYLAVIGKVRSYEPDGGGLYLSIRPEFIYEADPIMRDRVLLSAVRSLQTRLGALMEGRKMTEPSIDQLTALGFSKIVAEGILRSMESYGSFPTDQYQTYLKDTLEFLTEHNGHNNKPLPIDDTQTNPEISNKLTDDNEEDRSAIERSILDIINKTPGSNKLGINWNELLGEIKNKGIDRKLAEEIIRELMSKGVIYEPILGVIKRIG
jgi:RPA family protein